DNTAVSLYFCFTRASCANTATETFQVFPHAPQSWQYVLVLSQLHLRPCLCCFCPAGKNVEDEIGAVNSFYIQYFFNVVDLRSAEFVIKDDNTDIFSLDVLPDLF